MKTINGELYSTKQFDEYELKLIFEIITEDSSYTITVYTTEKLRINAIENIVSKVSKKVEFIDCVHYATKEQDDLASEFIEETLKNW